MSEKFHPSWCSHKSLKECAEYHPGATAAQEGETKRGPHPHTRKRWWCPECAPSPVPTPPATPPTCDEAQDGYNLGEPNGQEAPGHTDLMVSPEGMDKYLEENPQKPPESSTPPHAYLPKSPPDFLVCAWEDCELKPWEHPRPAPPTAEEPAHEVWCDKIVRSGCDCGASGHSPIHKPEEPDPIASQTVKALCPLCEGGSRSLPVELHGVVAYVHTTTEGERLLCSGSAVKVLEDENRRLREEMLTTAHEAALTVEGMTAAYGRMHGEMLDEVRKAERVAAEEPTEQEEISEETPCEHLGRERDPRCRHCMMSHPMVREEIRRLRDALSRERVANEVAQAHIKIVTDERDRLLATPLPTEDDEALILRLWKMQPGPRDAFRKDVLQKAAALIASARAVERQRRLVSESHEDRLREELAAERQRSNDWMARVANADHDGSEATDRALAAERLAEDRGKEIARIQELVEGQNILADKIRTSYKGVISDQRDALIERAKEIEGLKAELEAQGAIPPTSTRIMTCFCCDKAFPEARSFAFRRICGPCFKLGPGWLARVTEALREGRWLVDVLLDLVDWRKVEGEPAKAQARGDAFLDLDWAALSPEPSQAQEKGEKA